MFIMKLRKQIISFVISTHIFYFVSIYAIKIKDGENYEKVISWCSYVTFNSYGMFK